MPDLPPAEVHVWVVRGDDPHGAMRRILGEYVEEPAASLRIAAAQDGKPFLPDHEGIRFNLSHTRGVALVAVARREVGVDVEARRSVRQADGVARRIMTRDELARYEAREGEADRLDFLSWVWARKEALVKASGRGLRGSLREVACEPLASSRWQVVDLDVPGTAAAVAAEGRDWAPVVRSFE